MTEDEAKTKWCPFARVSSAEGEAHNRSGSDDHDPAIEDILISEALCIGSACMAWRWEQIPHPNTIGGFMRSGKDGFCGLAGKP